MLAISSQVVLAAPQVVTQPVVPPPLLTGDDPDGMLARLAKRLDENDDDDWAADFFELDGPPDPDRDEHPKPLQFELPGSLDQAPPVTEDASPEMAGWIRWLILQNLPPNYEDRKKWGKQKKIFDGWDFEREGFKIETRRKYKTVNHGTWTRYYMEWIEPVTALKIHLSPPMEVRPRTYLFRLEVESPIHLFGRLSRYQWDAQLISISADAEAYVKLWLDIELEVRLNPLELPPMIQFLPKATDGHIELTSFRMTRLSHFNGPVVKLLSHSLREMMEDKVAEYDDKLVEKVNKQLDKQQEKLKLSLQNWVASKFGNAEGEGK